LRDHLSLAPRGNPPEVGYRRLPRDHSVAAADGLMTGRRDLAMHRHAPAAMQIQKAGSASCTVIVR
jgi:hypothetical protein